MNMTVVPYIDWCTIRQTLISLRRGIASVYRRGRSVWLLFHLSRGHSARAQPARIQPRVAGFRVQSKLSRGFLERFDLLATCCPTCTTLSSSTPFGLNSGSCADASQQQVTEGVAASSHTDAPTGFNAGYRVWPEIRTSAFLFTTQLSGSAIFAGPCILWRLW